MGLAAGIMTAAAVWPLLVLLWTIASQSQQILLVDDLLSGLIIHHLH